MLSLPRARVHSLVGELRSHRLCGIPKKYSHTMLSKSNRIISEVFFFSPAATRIPMLYNELWMVKFSIRLTSGHIYHTSAWNRQTHLYEKNHTLHFPKFPIWYLRTSKHLTNEHTVSVLKEKEFKRSVTPGAHYKIKSKPSTSMNLHSW